MRLPLCVCQLSFCQGRFGCRHDIAVKSRDRLADTVTDMIISDEQAKLAAAYLRERKTPVQGGPSEAALDTPTDLVDRARAAIAALPDTRADRVSEAKEQLAALPGAQDVASKMLSRIVSDSLR